MGLTQEQQEKSIEGQLQKMPIATVCGILKRFPVDDRMQIIHAVMGSLGFDDIYWEGNGLRCAHDPY